MEEEARRILREAVSASERIGDLALQLFGSRHGVDLELPERAPHEPVDLRE
jgi:plasmid stability protein